MLYKLINGKLVTPPRTGVKKDGGTVSGYNRMAKHKLVADGWKPIVVEQLPESADTQYESYYIETETEILQKWRVVDENE